MVEILAIFHNYIAKLLNSTLHIYDDKLLHFVVIGVAGIILFFIAKPIFNYLTKKNLVISITFIYIFTLLVVITFGIEIGQKITNTGEMEFRDIVAGLAGFLSIFVFYVLIYYLIKYFKERKGKNQVS